MNRTKFLDEYELAELKRTLSKYPGRDSTMLKLALATGARAEELLAISQADLDVRNQSVFIRGSKGSDDREIPLVSELFNEVAQHVPWGIKYRRYEYIWRNYRPVKKKLHCLRHTFAIELYKRTKDIKLVQMCLGHKSLTSTQVYADFVYRQGEMRRLVIDNVL